MHTLALLGSLVFGSPQGVYVGGQQSGTVGQVGSDYRLNAVVEARFKISDRLGWRVTFVQPTFDAPNDKLAPRQIVVGAQLRVF